VSPPRPIDVKKLIAKRVLRGLSRGKRPPKYSCIESSFSRAFISFRPRFSAISWNRILMKILDDDVVSSSLKWMYLGGVGVRHHEVRE